MAVRPRGAAEYLRSEYVNEAYRRGLSDTAVLAAATCRLLSRPATATSAACASGTLAASSTPAMIGSMISANTGSRSSEPAPPPVRVSAASPATRSMTKAMSPASNDAAAVTRIVRTTKRLANCPLGGFSAHRSSR